MELGTNALVTKLRLASNGWKTGNKEQKLSCAKAVIMVTAALFNMSDALSNKVMSDLLAGKYVYMCW
jgi:hypothetical protein